jgi:hypothetical protein
MDEEVNSKINEIKAIDVENNLLLKKLVKQGQIALWSKLAYWFIIILITIGAFAVIKPMFSSLSSVYMPEGSSFNPSATLNSLNELKTQLEE